MIELTTRRIAICLIAIVAMLSSMASAAGVTNLRCEYLSDPLGIDVEKPRLSWMTEGGDPKTEIRGQRQIAYQILVASTTELLANDLGELCAGPNAVGVMLGNGRFYAMRSKVPFGMQEFGFPKLLMQLEVDYRDGTRQIISSDETWRVTDAGPIRANNEYDGEEYDARMELPGWAEPGYNVTSWQPAARVQAPQGRLQAQMIEPTRVTEVRKPVAITQPKPAMFLIDMGQAYYGTVRLKVAGPAGTRVQLRSAYGLNADVSPTYWVMYNSGIVWPSNIAILPEIQYDLYGDRRALEVNYAALTRWMRFISRHLKPDFTVDLIKYGDWCDAYSMDGGHETGGTADSLIATAYYFNNCRITARIAQLLGTPDDTKRFSELATKICDGFNRRFFDAKKNTYGTGTQTSDVLPLAFGMVPAEHRAAVAEHLAHDVQIERKGHLSTGMVGVFWLMQVLTDTGHGDAAWTVLTQTTRPSWGYMISKGATTVWERWDSDTRDPGMNSAALLILAGNLDAWLYRTLAGINPDPAQPGFKHIILKPQPLGDLAYEGS